MMTHAFDPAKWLGKFQSVGGGYSLSDSCSSLMYQINGAPIEDVRAACRMITDLTAETRARLIAYLCGRNAGEA